MNRVTVHVNQHVIRRNRKLRLNDAPITTKYDGENYYGHRVEVWHRGELIGTFRYMPPLSCGATVYFETEPDEDTEVVVR